MADPGEKKTITFIGLGNGLGTYKHLVRICLVPLTILSTLYVVTNYWI